MTKESRIGAESLRGLAAAANALSNEDAIGEDTAPRSAPPTESRQRSVGQISQRLQSNTSSETLPTRPDASLPEETVPLASTLSAVNENQGPTTDIDTDVSLLPPYVIKTIGPDGWKVITNAKDWYDVLLEKAFAVWADGVCNVLVELVDLPAPVQTMAAAPIQRVVDTGGGSEEIKG